MRNENRVCNMAIGIDTFNELIHGRVKITGGLNPIAEVLSARYIEHLRSVVLILYHPGFDEHKPGEPMKTLIPEFTVNKPPPPLPADYPLITPNP